MRAWYENRTRYVLPRRTYTLLRIDGRAFHSFTRGCAKPFDWDLMAAMDATAKSLCEQIHGARFAYVQSDEISLLLTDFERPTTDAWFDAGVQKMASISAAMATAAFNRTWLARQLTDGRAPEEVLSGYEWALFDSRVFTVPERGEVLNYFIWRQQDAVRNSIQMAGQACFSQTELQGKTVNQVQEMLFQEQGINWNDYPAGAKRGRAVVPVTIERDATYMDPRTGELRTVTGVLRRAWQVVEPPTFTKGRAWLLALVPDRNNLEPETMEASSG
jgi:tRNA(His) guanylyltransferase